MKQFPKVGSQCDTSAIVELQIARLIQTAQGSKGTEHIAQLYDSVEDKKDLWLIYEVCRGKNLNECLFEVKGEFFKGERVYGVRHWRFYHCLRTNMSLMKDFIRRMCEAL